MVARLRRWILVLSLIALLFLPLAAQAEPYRVVQAEEILKKIELGEPVEYDNVTIVGDLNISGLELPTVFMARDAFEKKYLSLTENAKLVVSPIEITDCLILGSLNLNGTVIKENLICINTRFKGSAYLTGTHFQQAANFGNAKFNKTASFWYSQFNKDADFWYAQFNQTVHFGNAQFNQIAHFGNAQFNQIAYFQSAQFNQAAYFWNARFNQTDFNSVQFNQTAYFWNAWFNQTDFNNVQFNQTVYFENARFNQTANFEKAQFNQTTYFRHAKFNQAANFQSAQFNQTANFENVQFNQTAEFWNAQFNQTTYFWDARFNQTDFNSVQFNQTAYFWNAQFNQTANFEKVQFNQTTYFRHAKFNQDANFQAAQFNQEAYFEDAKLLNLFFNYSQFSKEAFFGGARINGTLSLYRTKYEKLNIRWSSIHDLTYDDTAYYLLIENFKKLGFTDDASECYYSYRYKHMWELLRQGKFDSWFFDLLAWATNGYGLRPVRPLGWSVLFILLGGAFFFVTKNISRSKVPEPSGNRLRAIRSKDSPQKASEVSIWEALLLSATYFTSGASSIISSVPEEFRPLGRSRYVVVILRLLGWIFFVLFLTSLGKIA
jgi:hypothetical protein